MTDNIDKLDPSLYTYPDLIEKIKTLTTDEETVILMASILTEKRDTFLNGVIHTDKIYQAFEPYFMQLMMKNLFDRTFTIDPEVKNNYYNTKKFITDLMADIKGMDEEEITLDNPEYGFLVAMLELNFMISDLENFNKLPLQHHAVNKSNKKNKKPKRKPRVKQKRKKK